MTLYIRDYISLILVIACMRNEVVTVEGGSVLFDYTPHSPYSELQSLGLTK